MVLKIHENIGLHADDDIDRTRDLAVICKRNGHFRTEGVAGVGNKLVVLHAAYGEGKGLIRLQAVGMLYLILAHYRTGLIFDIFVCPVPGVLNDGSDVYRAVLTDGYLPRYFHVARRAVPP